MFSPYEAKIIEKGIELSWTNMVKNVWPYSGIRRYKLSQIQYSIFLLFNSIPPAPYALHVI